MVWVSVFQNYIYSSLWHGPNQIPDGWAGVHAGPWELYVLRNLEREKQKISLIGACHASTQVLQNIELEEKIYIVLPQFFVKELQVFLDIPPGHSIYFI